MSNRDKVLRRISSALGRTEQDRPTSEADQPVLVTRRIHHRTATVLPAITDDLMERLVERMEAALISVVRLQTLSDCPAAIDWYLESNKIDASEPGAVTVSPALRRIAWPSAYQTGRATGSEQVSITPCLAAVAETGSVVTASGPETPSTLNFLPENHIVILFESQVVKRVDDVFPRFNEDGKVPRVVNFLTGPSRTADIEQTLEIGAHGPRRMHVLLVAGEPPENY